MAVKEMQAALISLPARVLSRPFMRPVVRAFTDLHVRLYRLTGGKAQVPQFPTLLLTTRGRKTGKARTIPLVYVMDGDRFIIAAAYAGSDRDPVWWLNLKHTDEGVVQVMRRQVRVRPAVARPEEREEFWRRLVAMYPSFTEYQSRTPRQIPIIVLTPIETQ